MLHHSRRPDHTKGAPTKQWAYISELPGRPYHISEVRALKQHHKKLTFFNLLDGAEMYAKLNLASPHFCFAPGSFRWTAEDLRLNPNLGEGTAHQLAKRVIEENAGMGITVKGRHYHVTFSEVLLERPVEAPFDKYRFDLLCRISGPPEVKGEIGEILGIEIECSHPLSSEKSRALRKISHETLEIWLPERIKDRIAADEARMAGGGDLAACEPAFRIWERQLTTFFNAFDKRNFVKSDADRQAAAKAATPASPPLPAPPPRPLPVTPSASNHQSQPWGVHQSSTASSSQRTWAQSTADDTRGFSLLGWVSAALLGGWLLLWQRPCTTATAPDQPSPAPVRPLSPPRPQKMDTIDLRRESMPSFKRRLWRDEGR